MQNELMKKIERYLAEHKKKKRTYAVLFILSALMAGTVYGSLCVPAVSMTKDEPHLEARAVRAVFGEELSFRVSAEAAKGDDPSVFVLHTESNGAGLSDYYNFEEIEDEDGNADGEVCLIDTDEGNIVELHREFKKNGEVNYWFSLEPEEIVSFSLNCNSDMYKILEAEEAERKAEKREEEAQNAETESGQNPGAGAGNAEKEETQPEKEIDKDEETNETPDNNQQGDSNTDNEENMAEDVKESETSDTLEDNGHKENGNSQEEEESGRSEDENQEKEDDGKDKSDPGSDAGAGSDSEDSGSESGTGNENGGSEGGSSDKENSGTDSSPESGDTEKGSSDGSEGANSGSGSSTGTESESKNPGGGSDSGSGDGDSESEKGSGSEKTDDVSAAGSSDNLISHLFLRGYALDEDTAETWSDETQKPDSLKTKSSAETRKASASDAEKASPSEPEAEKQFLRIYGGAGKKYVPALREAKRKDNSLELIWSEEYEEITLTAETESGVTVVMTGPEDSFPEGDLRLVVRELEASKASPSEAAKASPSEAAAAVLAEWNESMEEEEEQTPVQTSRWLFDICLMDGDKEIEPIGPVQVSFEGLAANGGNTKAAVFHVDERRGTSTVTDMDAWADDEGNVVMNTDHFSTFEVVVMAEEGTGPALDDIMDVLGGPISGAEYYSVNHFGVFAKNMTPGGGHSASNIAVGSLDFTKDSGLYVDIDGSVITALGNRFNIRVSKIYNGTGNPPVSCSFGLYEAGNTVQFIKKIELDVVDNKCSGVFENLDTKKTYVVYQLDAEGNPILEPTEELKWEGGPYRGTGNETFIGEFIVGSGEKATLQLNGGSDFVLHVGNQYTVEQSQIKNNGTVVAELQNFNSGKAVADCDIDWDSEFVRLTEFAQSLNEWTANTYTKNDSSPGVKILNVTVQEAENEWDDPFKSALAKAMGESDLVNGLTNNDHALGEKQYLVVNVHVVEGVNNINLPPVKIGGGTGEIPVAQRIIWNFGNFSGSVTTGDNTMGTLLLPEGTVKQVQNHNGEIIAETFNRQGGELHKLPFEQIYEPEVRFTEGGEASGFPLVLKKTDLEGKPVNGAEFDLYKANENWEKGELIKNAISAEDGMFTFDNLLAGNYLLYETKAADGFILPAEPWKVSIGQDGAVTMTKPNGEAMLPVSEEGSVSQQYFQIVNQKGDQHTNISVNKIWVGDDGKHPSQINVWLLKNGTKVDPSVTLSNSNEWSYTWSDLPLDENGVQISYTVQEETVDGYYATISRTEDAGDGKASGWVKAEGFTDGQTYILVYGSGPYEGQALARVEGYSANITTVNVDINSSTKPDSNAMWQASSSGNGFTLTSNGRNLGLTSEGVSAISAASDGYSKAFVFADSHLSSTYGNVQYYLSDGFKRGKGRVTSYYSYASAFALYEWQESTNPNINYTITNTKEAVIPNKPNLEHHKTIDALRDNQNNPDTSLDDSTTDDMTDFYRLYLDVKTGMMKTPVDVVLVLDNSASMQEEDMGGETRAKAVVDNAEWFAEKILSSDSRNNVSVVGYSGSWTSGIGENGMCWDYDMHRDFLYSSGKSDAWSKSGWSKNYKALQTDDLNPLLKDVIGGTTGSGTNIMQALRKAGTLLEESETKRPEANRYMIFISDGYPTYYYLRPDTAGVTNSQDYGWYYGIYFTPYKYNQSGAFDSGYYQGRFGTGTADSGDYAKQPTIDYANAFHTSHDDTIVYTLGVEGKEETTSPLMEDTLKKIATDPDNYFVANDKKKLEEAFQTIMYGHPVSHVEVTDQLSQYVNWYGSQPDVLVTMKDKNDNVTRLWEGTGAAGSGAVGHPTVSGQSIIESVTYTPVAQDNQTDGQSTGTVTVKFKSDYVLENDCVYTLSFNVQTTQTAYEEYAKNLQENGSDGYRGVEGDENTDYSNTLTPGFTNDTSSGYPGFHSNQSADVQYVMQNINYTEAYDHPVIQVASCGLILKKQDVADQNKLLMGAEFDLYRAASGEGAVTIPGTDPAISGIKINAAPLVTGEDGQVTVENLSPAVYYLVETKAPSGYIILEKPVRFLLKLDGVDVSGDGPEQNMVHGETAGEGQNQIPVLVIKNSNGFELPHTGGKGSVPYTAAGLFMILMAAGCYVKKRPLERKES